MSEICITSSSGGDARRDVLAGRRRRRDERVVVADQRDDDRRGFLGELVLEMRRIGEQHLAHAGELGGCLGGRLGVVPGHEHVDVAAELLGSGNGLGGRRLQRAIGVLGKKKNGHQSTPASALSFCTSSATLPTLTPALRLAGSAIFSTLRRGVTSTPKSSGFLMSSGFFFAFMMLGSEG